MNKIYAIIIGVVVFILILGATFNSGTSNKSKKTKSNQINGEVVTELIYQGKFPIPVEKFIQVTSWFGIREGNKIVSTNHKGIDLCGTKNSRVFSVMDGEITYSGWQSGYGNCVEIKHTDNQNVFYTFYGHMKDDSLQVTKGQKVVKGQVLGVQGSTR